MMTVAQAQALLKLIDAETRSVRSIKAAWARELREVHPDTKLAETHPFAASCEAAALIGKLTQARDVLLGYAAGEGRRCKCCNGSGRVRQRFGSIRCASCKGTGETR